jgi:branched-subunit amino acid ABC-type transport system permease component
MIFGVMKISNFAHGITPWWAPTQPYF